MIKIFCKLLYGYDGRATVFSSLTCWLNKFHRLCIWSILFGSNFTYFSIKVLSTLYGKPPFHYRLMPYFSGLLSNGAIILPFEPIRKWFELLLAVGIYALSAPRASTLIPKCPAKWSLVQTAGFSKFPRNLQVSVKINKQQTDSYLWLWVWVTEFENSNATIQK